VRPNELPPVPGSVHKKKRIGRGNSSGHGTYSTRGIKGQQSRSGPDLRIGFEGGQIPLIRALSRKRGFNNRFRVEYEPVNVGQLAKFAAGTTVTSESLRSAAVVKSARLPVKLLGDGEISVSLTVQVERVSASARAKIEAAGGTVTETSPRVEKETKEQRSRAGSSATADSADEPELGSGSDAVATPSPAADSPEDAETQAPARRTRAPRARAEAPPEETAEEEN
jgi:large subunit ribosomal protein L15